MRDVENVLREAMADDVAAVTAPPDLTGRVQARNRHHRRVRVAAALVALAAMAVAAPLVTIEVRQAVSPADRPAVDEVDGVELTYLPDGLRRDPVDGLYLGDPHPWRAITGRWYPESVTGPEKSQEGVRVTVYRGEWIDFYEDRRILSYLTLPVGPRPLTEPVREEGGRVYFRTPPSELFGGWIDVIWPAADGVTLRVRVSDDLEGQLERIVRGLRVVAPGGGVGSSQPPSGGGGLCAPATNVLIPLQDNPLDPGWSRFGGVVLDHVPDGLEGPFVSVASASGLMDDPASARSWYYTYRWGTTRDMPEVISVRVGCGDAVPQDAAGLPTRWWPDKDAKPYHLPDGRPALLADDSGGTAIAWLARPGAVVELRVHRTFEAELDEILAGIEIISP